jgi:hypothetical protein
LFHLVSSKILNLDLKGIFFDLLTWIDYKRGRIVQAMVAINEKSIGDGYDATRGLEISPAQAIEDDVYEERVKGADAIFAYVTQKPLP